MSNLKDNSKEAPANEPKGPLLLKRLLIFFGIITVFIAVWVVTTYLNSRKNLSVALLEQFTEKADIHLSKFFEPVISAANVFKGWGGSGKFDHFSADTINAVVIPLMEQLPQVHSLVVATEKELLYLLQRDGKGWLVYESSSIKNKNTKPMWRRLSSDGQKKEIWPAEEQIVPGNQRWFRETSTARQQEPFWISPHRLPFVDKKAISAVVKWEQGGRLHVVAAFNVRVSDVRQQLESMSVTESSHVFLFADGQPLIDSAWQENDQPAPAKQAGPDSVAASSVVPQALGKWREHKESSDPFRFQVAGTPWWAQLLRFKGSGRKADGLGVLAPEKELLALQRPEKYFFILAALALLWVGLLVFSRKYLRESARRGYAFDTRQIPEDVIRKMIAAGESERMEFKSTLRWNLKADRAGKEIELACLKTVAAFMNSDGGTLLVGVADDGTVTGIEADRFDSDDKYLQHFSNIFKQHIGLAFSEHVEFALRPIDDRQVLVVTCEKSPRPVFVRDKKSEHFYIRSGPSSRDLTPSQLLDYVAKRFA